MKLSKNMLKALNKQYHEELYSAYLYKHMSLWANAQDLPGMTHWFAHQDKEEIEHAEKLYHYILERNENVELEAIDKPSGSWKTMVDVMKAALEHEEYISSRILELVEQANKEKDYATVSFLQWYLKEQVEEEAHATYWVKRLEKCNGQNGALMIVDGEMGRRS